MNMKQIVASAGIAGTLGFAALGVGAGIAQAKPHVPGPPVPWCNGPGANCLGPGDPRPLGQNYQRPPGHEIPGVPDLDPDDFRPPVDWDDVPPPVWAPQAPPPPEWAPNAPVVWNVNLLRWGIWYLDQFIPL